MRSSRSESPTGLPTRGTSDSDASMRPLLAIEADPQALMQPLREALSGDGPALLAYPLGGSTPQYLPREVPKRIALVVETSGSAGAPKRVALSADALLASAGMTESALGGPGRWLLALPVHYIAGIQVLVRSIVAGIDPVMIDPGSDADAFAAALEQFGRERRYASLVPAQLEKLVSAAESDPRLVRSWSSIDRVLVGGQRTPESLMKRAAAVGFELTRTYGSSETAGGCFYDGAPLGATRARIDDGEVLIASPSLAEGYLGDDSRTAASFVSAEGTRWYRTGDEGSVVDGRLVVTGRRDDVVISGGEKVSLGLVEAAVREIPGHGGAVVVAGADPRWGEVPVVITSGPDELDAIRAAVADRLGRAAAPARLVRLEKLPLLASGKPDRAALRGLVESSATDPAVVRVSAVLVHDVDGRLLLVRKHGTTRFMQPGGKPEPGETASGAAVRELREETGIVVDEAALEFLGEFEAQAANEPGHLVIAQTYAVQVEPREVAPRAEIAEAVWVSAADAIALPLAPLTADHVLPLLADRHPGSAPRGE